MGFINNANQIIGANMRYLQQFQANQQSAGGAQTASTSGASGADDAAMQSMMPMLLMMLMLKLMGQGPGPVALPPGFPPNGPFPGGPFPNVPHPPQQDASQWIQQNPAYQFLRQQLPVLSSVGPASAAADPASGSTSLAAGIAKPDFAINDSLASAMNALLSASGNVSRHSLGTQLLSGTTNGTDLNALKRQVQDEMTQEGRSPRDIQAFGILFDAMRNNTDLAAARLMIDEDSPAQVDRSLQVQQALSKRWDDLSASHSAADDASASASATPNAAAAATSASANSAAPATATDTPTLVQNVRTALADGRFTRQELGQSLKFLLDRAPAEALPQLSGLIGGLMKSGDLNVPSFLNPNYLNQLSLERKEALLNAVKDAGLTLSDGKPNGRFAAFVLDNLSRAENSPTAEFLHKFLQNAWLQHGADTTGAEGKALHSLLNLAGIEGAAGQPLSFS